MVGWALCAVGYYMLQSTDSRVARFEQGTLREYINGPAVTSASAPDAKAPVVDAKGEWDPYATDVSANKGAGTSRLDSRKQPSVWEVSP